MARSPILIDEVLRDASRDRHRERRLLDARYFARIHLGKSETLPAKVFQRCADEIKLLVVDDEEAVVEGFVVTDGEFRVLGVEGHDVGWGDLAVGHVLLVVVLRGEDREPHALALLREEIERFRRRPVVDEGQRTLRSLYQFQHQRPRVPQLSVVEHTLQRWLRRVNTLQDGVHFRIRCNLPLLHSLDSLKHLRVRKQEPAHCGKSPHNADIRFDGRRRCHFP